MADLRVASRYVKSLLSLAVEQNVLEQVHNDFILFSQVVDQNHGLLTLLKSPIIRHEKKREILYSIFKEKVNKLTLSIIDILTKKNREPLLPLIAKEFHEAYNEYKGIGKASVVSTIPLDAELRNEITEIVKKLSNKNKVELNESVDKELVGGFILKVGDLQVDASIKSKLRALALTFEQNQFVKEI